jgi:long-chain acyl-CoA synthetase
MSTSKVLKNSTPHQVKVREGSKDAQRQPVKAKTEAVSVPQAIQRKFKTEVVKAKPQPVKVKSAAPKPKPKSEAVKLKAEPAKKKSVPVKLPATRKTSRSAKVPAAVSVPAAVAVPPSIAKKTSAPAKPKVQEKPSPVDTSSKPTVTVPPPVARASAPDHELWESDSPVMRRISLLRTRNAQLSEQVQRLKKPA